MQLETVLLDNTKTIIPNIASASYNILLKLLPYSLLIHLLLVMFFIP